MQVLHHCDNRRCVNPSHLFLGTNADNVADRVSKGRDGDHRGVNNGRAVIGSLDALAIREARRRGVSAKDLGERYGMRTTTIYKIAKGRLWGHV
jgi:hypothetical protein